MRHSASAFPKSRKVYGGASSPSPRRERKKGGSGPGMWNSLVQVILQAWDPAVTCSAGRGPRSRPSKLQLWGSLRLSQTTGTPSLLSEDSKATRLPMVSHFSAVFLFCGCATRKAEGGG